MGAECDFAEPPTSWALKQVGSNGDVIVGNYGMSEWLFPAQGIAYGLLAGVLQPDIRHLIPPSERFYRIAGFGESFMKRAYGNHSHPALRNDKRMPQNKGLTPTFRSGRCITQL